LGVPQAFFEERSQRRGPRDRGHLTVMDDHALDCRRHSSSCGSGLADAIASRSASSRSRRLRACTPRSRRSYARPARSSTSSSGDDASARGCPPAARRWVAGTTRWQRTLRSCSPVTSARLLARRLDTSSVARPRTWTRSAPCLACRSPQCPACTSSPRWLLNSSPSSRKRDLGSGHERNARPAAAPPRPVVRP